MTLKRKLNQKTVAKFFLVAVASFFLSVSVFGQGQHSKSRASGNTKFVGYSLAGSTRQYQIKSNIKAIDRLSVPSYGVNAGIVRGNERGAFRAQAGLYYASASLPYSIDGLELGVSKTVYLLRLNQIKYHAVEPYITADITGQRASFFGNYLETRPQHKNKSMATETLLGRVSCLRASVGLGLEYQLISNNTFINFFAEAKYGTAFSYHATQSEFSDTTIKNPISVDLGVNFGNLIFR